jgi:signal transduction histidine kinase
MSFKPFFALFLASFFLQIAGAQQYNRDSVQRLIDQIHKAPVDTGQIRQLNDLAYTIGENDSSLSKQLLTEALEKSISIKDPAAIVNSYRFLGLWYSGVGNNDKALEYHRSSLQTATRNDLLYLAAGAYFNIGNIKYWKGEYDSCIDYYLKTQQIFENPKILENKTLTQRVLDKKKSDLYSNISTVFSTLKNLPKADEYIDKALAIAESYKATKVIAIYTQQKANNYAENGDVEKALRTRLKYLPELEKGEVAKIYLQTSYQNISQEYYDLEKIDSSKIFAQKSLQIASELEVPDAIANANWQMGRLAMKEKQFTLAEEYLEKCSDYFLQNEDPNVKKSYFDVMHQLMFATGRYKEAYEYFGNYHDLNDTILNSERAKQFSEREARYQSEKKDSQIKLQTASIKQKSTLNLLLAGAVLAFVVIGLLAYRNYRHYRALQQQRIAELQTEKQLAATEAVLKGEEQERTRLAKDLHDGLGGMLSGIKYSLNTMKGNLIMTPENGLAFERSMDMLDSSIKEMRRVAHNMMPEALVKFGLDTALKDFCNDINQSGALKVTYQPIGIANAQINDIMAITIFRIAQELVNNTLKHAAAKSAIVQVSKSDNTIAVTVEDDGKGFNTMILRQAKGIGWSNIENRVEFLRGKLDVSSQEGKGTSVHIEFTT